jgi:menaquinone-9 beta-reductase
MPAYDAIVVGGGPAGAATAAHLARGGASVVLVDRASFPRDKACGGGLTPRGVGALQRLGVDLDSSEAIRAGGLEMGFGPGETIDTAFPSTTRWPSHALVGRRSVMDQRVLQEAEKSGVEIRTARVTGPIFEDGTCRGVRVRADGGSTDLEAEWTVAADGATSTTARAAGLLPPASSRNGFWYRALRAYLAPVEPRVGADGLPLLEFYPLRGRDGRWLPAYGWVFPLPDGSANVGVDIPHVPSLEACPPLRDAFDEFLVRMRRERGGFEDAELLAPAQGALLPEAMSGCRPAAPGILAVGDASGLITPYSGEGIVYALESAELAAEAILKESSPSAVTRRYSSSLDEIYGFHFASALRFMKLMRRRRMAGAAVAVGRRSGRVFRGAVRIMAYLIEDESDQSSTVSRGYHKARRIWSRLPKR